MPDAVTHAISTRHGGASSGPFASLNLSAAVGDKPELVRHNRGVFVEGLGLRLEDTVALAQVHGCRVVQVSDKDKGRGVLDEAPPPERADAMITNAPGVPLLVLAADCVPLLFFDPRRRAVGAAHAGWRGAVSGVAPATVRALGQAFGSRPGDLLVGVGPAIGCCCYEVDEPVLAPLRAALPEEWEQVTQPARPGHCRLDLQETVRRQLVRAGVPAAQIQTLGLCTACHPEILYSERAEGRPSGRFGALIALS